MTQNDNDEVSQEVEIGNEQRQIGTDYTTNESIIDGKMSKVGDIDVELGELKE